MLFGPKFHQKVKDHLENLRSLKKSAGYSIGQYFWKSRPQQTRGGGNQKGNKGKQKYKQVDVFPYLKTRRFCVLLHYLKLPLV